MMSRTPRNRRQFFADTVGEARARGGSLDRAVARVLGGFTGAVDRSVEWAVTEAERRALMDPNMDAMPLLWAWDGMDAAARGRFYDAAGLARPSVVEQLCVSSARSRCCARRSR